ncbi:hypothetical protein DFO45_4136 [Azorhizobium sp. AG788]|nr:hypothetical protein DFO45_4136 [Azorhizobium sp. AG788]
MENRAILHLAARPLRTAAAALALGCAMPALLPLCAVTPALAAPAEQLQELAVDAYLYFYPLVTMDVTRKQLTNLPKGAGIGGPANSFVNVPAFPSADMRAVVRPNFDTLYSSAWLDLTQGPIVVSVPDTDGRYYLLPMMDMWTDVFASPGSRTTGTKAGNFLVTPPGWTGTVPEGVTRIGATTPFIWIIGRTKTDGPADYPAVHKIQAGFKLTPLAYWGKGPAPEPEQKIDASVDVKTPPKIQVDTMPGPAFFAYAAELLKLHPPHATDQPIIAQLKRLGIEPGQSLDPSKLPPETRAAMEAAPEKAQHLMLWKLPTLARVVNNWSLNTDTMGVYGNYYLKRAIVAQVGLGANVPQDAVYPMALLDGQNQPLDGVNAYLIRFEKGAVPPVDAFWSITLYDKDGFQVANPLNRFAVSSWMPLKTDPDGGLTLFIQADNPGKEREANWLPTPKGPFNLTMRLYAPRSDVLTGRWAPPAVEKQPATALLPQ